MNRIIFLVIGMAFALLLWPTAQNDASAHQNGCHRWHSCPSDNGSYVCGDLGYDKYCPKNTSKDDSKKQEKKKFAPRPHRSSY